jgi:hypothetical protein
VLITTHEHQRGPLQAELAEREQRQRNAHIAGIHKQRWERKTARAETKKGKIEADDQTHCGKNDQNAADKTAISSAKRGLLASELNTNDGVPK